tara:strand:+ start:1195 stop:1563 length:369 start_codon:yes stop_codon:yes gene_type:complete
MKLELKHLAPYLPYGLSIKNSIGKVIELTVMDFGYHLDKGFKPILRPLSDLTKNDIALITEYSDIENVVFSGNPSSLYFTNTEEKTYLDDYVDSLNYLYSRHFDIFGLIDKGLATDINTIKQ